MPKTKTKTKKAEKGKSEVNEMAEAFLLNLEKDETVIKKRLARYYKQEESFLKKEISNYYAEYGENGVIEFRKLMESASPMLRQQIFEEWETFIRLHPEYAELSPIRGSIYRLNRLEALQDNIHLQQLRIAENERALMMEHFESEANEAFKMWGDILATGPGSIPTGFWETCWVGKMDFVDSIKKNKIKISDFLQQDLAAGFARGDSYRRLTDKLIERFDKVSRRDAYRLVYTSGTHVYAQANAAACRPYFLNYHFSTVGDSKVCPICAALHGQSFRFSDRQTGVNFPPMHPFCRCSFEVDYDHDAFIEEYTKQHTREQAEQVAQKFEVR